MNGTRRADLKLGIKVMLEGGIVERVKEII